MVSIILTKEDYDDVVFSAINGDTPGTVGDLRAADSLMIQLEQLGDPCDIPAHPCKNCGNPRSTETTETYKMRDEFEEMLLDSTEAKYLRTRLIKVLPQLQVRRSRKLLPLLDALDVKTE